MIDPDLDEVDTSPFERCDGIHAEEAPDHYLCTRCFPHGRRDPDGGDLVQVDDAENVDESRSESQETD